MNVLCVSLPTEQKQSKIAAKKQDFMKWNN